MICSQCQSEFAPARASAKFCSPRCRKAASRKAEPVPAVVTAARKLQEKVNELGAGRKLFACCKHCPDHPHARHLDACRQGCP